MDDRTADDAASFSSVFDQLAAALNEAAANDRHRRSHSSFGETTLRMARASDAPPPRIPRGDRSRDFAVYAAPHRPSRPYVEPRPAEITTHRVFRQVNAAATQRSAGPIAALVVGAALTILAGVAALMLVT